MYMTLDARAVGFALALDARRAVRRADRLGLGRAALHKDDKQYESLRRKGMSKERAARIANVPGSPDAAAEHPAAADATT